MTTTHIFQMSKIDRLDTVVIPPAKYGVYDPFLMGEIDARDGKACEPLDYFSDLACVEHYILGYRSVTLPPLQEFIDAAFAMDLDAAEWDAADQSDYGSIERNFGCIEDDHDWIRGGC